jgi:hypothetical protein
VPIINENFFDINADYYSSIENQADYDFFIKYIIDSSVNSVADVGGGTSYFSKLILNENKSVVVTIIDPSQKLLDKIVDSRIHKINGSLPFPLNNNDVQYDCVHIKEVFHHITDRNVRLSKKKVGASLYSLNNIINDEGTLLIHDLYYESYIIPTLTRTLIFFACKIQNYLGVKIPLKKFILGLDICFYTRKELISLLENANFEIVDMREYEWPNCREKRILFLKRWGRQLYICKKIKK